MIRNWLTGGILAAASLGVGAAQAYAEVVPVLAQVKVSQTGGKTFIVESLVTVVLMGAALFVICKTSRRS